MDSETRLLRDRIRAQLESLPPERVAEVGDFVDSISKRENKPHATEHALLRVTSVLNKTAFERVWDNPEDAAYDHL
jgi:hypothetical protein